MPLNSHLDSDAAAEDEQMNIGASRVIALLWIARRAIFIGALVGAMFGIIALHLMTPKYMSYVVLRPNQDDSSLGRGSILGSGALSGLAGMIGLGSPGDFDAFSEVLTSDALARALIKEHLTVLPTLFPGSWDDKSHTYVRTGTLNAMKDAIRGALGLPAWHPPGAEEVAKYLQKNVSVSSDFKTKFLTISYADKNPVFARDLLTWIYSAGDRLVRETARDRAAARIRYLQSVLPTINQVETRQTLSNLLASEEQRMMMVQADQYFTMVLVKPPLVSTTPSSPSAASVIGMFLVLGAFLAGGWQSFIAPRFNILMPGNLFGRFRSSAGVLG